MHWLYINLAKRPDRNQQFLRTNSFLTGVQRVEAVDGSSLEMQTLIEQKIAHEPLVAYTPGAVGHALSHKRVWETCVSGGQPVTVAEDDAVFNRHFQEQAENILKTLRPDWDIVLWGWNFDSILHVQVIEGLREAVMQFDPAPLKQSISVFQNAQIRSIPLRLLQAFGNVCASISPRGAERLNTMCFPLRNEAVPIPGLGRNLLNSGLDTVMNRYYRTLNAYVCFPPLVWTENDKANSDI